MKTKQFARALNGYTIGSPPTIYERPAMADYIDARAIVGVAYIFTAMLIVLIGVFATVQ